MKQQSFSTPIGLGLILIGLFAFAQAAILPLFGIESSIWRIWPVLPLAGSLFMLAAPVLFSSNQGLRGLFIPAVPLVVIATMLLVASLFNWWSLWAVFWPAILMGLGAGFVLASIGMRNINLMIPAVIIGANGALFQFTALTGWWGLWSVLWTLEPFIIGVGLIIASGGRQRDLIKAGLILSTISLVTFSGMSLILSGWFGLLGAILLMGIGGGLLLRGRWPQEKLPAEKQPTNEFIKEKAPQEEFVI